MGSIPKPSVGTNEWKKLIKKDNIVIDDYIFRLHRQGSFLMIAFGIIFILGENYLDNKSIVCKEGGDYATKFCWLHGTSFISDNLKEKLKKMGESGSRHFDCSNNNRTDSRDAVKAYYIWLPFLLIIAAAITKFPRFMWKEVLGGGEQIEKLVQAGRGDLLPDQRRTDKVVEEYKSMKHSRKRFGGLVKLSIGYIFCEVLNIVALVVCFSIFDVTLEGQFRHYGSRTADYLYSEDGNGMSNPMCQIFPTVVSCTVDTVGVTKALETKNTICILSNNLFNMYYFLILWYWWVIMLALSIWGLFSRFVVMMVPAFSESMLLEDSRLKSRRLCWYEYYPLSMMKKNMDPDDYKQACFQIFSQSNHLTESSRMLNGNTENNAA